MSYEGSELQSRQTWYPSIEYDAAANMIDVDGTDDDPPQIRDVFRIPISDLLSQTTRSHRRRQPVIIGGRAVQETLRQRIKRETLELETAITVLAGQLTRRTEQLEHLNRFPLEDPSVDGTTLQFDRNFPANQDKRYSYVADRVEGRWYVTGARAPQGVTWDTLVDWMGLGVDEVYRLNAGPRAGRRKVIG